MLSILCDTAFSGTKCAGPTIAPAGTIRILSVCLTTPMNLSTQFAQQCGSLYFVGITTAYSWAWGCNINCWVFLHLIEKVDIILPVGRYSWNRRIWCGGVQLKYITGKEGTRLSKVLSRLLCIYWTQMLKDSGMIPWLASVYSTLEPSPSPLQDVGQWNGQL